jgi:hypothetical protein
MHDNERQAKLGYRGGVASRTKVLVAKTLSIVLGGVVLVSAFVVSIALFAIALTVVLAFGGYVWWKTRHLRRQMREQIHDSVGRQAGRRADATDDVIEGVVVSRKETSDHPRH